MKRWIKAHGIGRNEYIFAPKKYDFRFQNIYGTNVDFFLDLILKIDRYINAHLQIEDNKQFVDQLFNEDSSELIIDNFACYLALTKDKRLPAFIDAHTEAIPQELLEQLKVYC
jgi:hypothetical protein